MSAPDLLIYVGGVAPRGVAGLVAGAHEAIARDLLMKAGRTGVFQRCFLVTDSLPLASSVPDAIVVPSPHPFHFGESLRDLIRHYGIEAPLYVGGGAAPLLSDRRLAALAQRLARSPNAVIANNLYSSDLVAFQPGAALERVDLPAIDNPLAQRLRLQAGLRGIELPRNAATQFDVDTPGDLAILAALPRLGGHLGDYIRGLGIETGHVEAALALLTDPGAEVLVAGRVSSQVWRYLERQTACRVRLYSEERGMRADGREEAGRVRSLLGRELVRLGPEEFFRELAGLCDAILLDTRVLFACAGWRLTESDRFSSDLLRPSQIEHEGLRAFTRAAAGATVPVVLGGHSLVSGGLYALVDAAWARQGHSPSPRAPDHRMI
ncbi:MAG: hypothetical protein HYY05_08180 [Chloroflexi bacterium]|nr:hypothetical protein [Chloroflexota bacterium]